MPRRRNKGEERGTGEARIAQLLARARVEALRGRAGLADRYGHLALRIAEKYQTGLDAAAKAQVCRKCGAFRGHASSRTRVRSGRLVTTCLRCGAVSRRPLAQRAAPARSPSSTGTPSRAR